jgi:hypothetical protein
VAVGNSLCRQVGASRTLANLFREHGKSSQRRQKGARKLPVKTGGLRSSQSAHSTFNHARHVPHRLEHRELRIVYWSTLITLLRVALLIGFTLPALARRSSGSQQSGAVSFLA